MIGDGSQGLKPLAESCHPFGISQTVPPGRAFSSDLPAPKGFRGWLPMCQVLGSVRNFVGVSSHSCSSSSSSSSSKLLCDVASKMWACTDGLFVPKELNDGGQPESFRGRDVSKKEPVP